MVEIISWIIAALIGLGAVVGFTGVVATSVVTLVRRVGRPQAPASSARPFTSVG